MLKRCIINPGNLQALGEAGAGAQVLIADGNYSLRTRSNDAGHRVYLELDPGLVTVTDVLRVLVDAIPVEAAHVMTPDDGTDPEIFGEFRQLLPGIELERLGRFPFYDAARGQDVALAIATGEERIYANL